MQFGLLTEVEIPYGAVGRCASLFIFMILIILFHHSLVLWAEYRQLRRFARSLEKLLKSGLETGNWDLPPSSKTDIKGIRFSATLDALTRELPGKGPFAVAGILSQEWDLLTGPLKMKTHRLLVLGLGACLLGLIGALSEFCRIFRFMGRPDSPDFNWHILGGPIALFILLFLYGLAVGLACLVISGFYRDRLRSLIISASKPISGAIANART